MEDIVDYRAKYPVVTYEKNEKVIDCLIPFSSEIKFNLYIRDMNKAQPNPSTREDNMMVIMKGAPERILNRCSKVLIKGVEREFDDVARKFINDAND